MSNESNSEQTTGSVGPRRTPRRYEAPAALAVDIVVLTVCEALNCSRLWSTRRAVSALFPERPRRGAGGAPADRGPEARVRRPASPTSTSSNSRPSPILARDPRGWIPTRRVRGARPCGDGAERRWWLTGFRHPPVCLRSSMTTRRSFGAAMDRVRGQLWWSNIAVVIDPGEFTLAEARNTYRAITSIDYDPSTFARDLRATGLIEPTGNERTGTRGRPRGAVPLQGAVAHVGRGVAASASVPHDRAGRSARRTPGLMLLARAAVPAELTQHLPSRLAQPGRELARPARP